MKNSLTEDAYAILLLCAFQGGEEEFMPLGLAEYNRVASVLYQLGKRPRDLLETQSFPKIPGVRSDRLHWLLGRRINLGFCLEEWQRKGYWVLARSDSAYPKAIRASMRNNAPPLLFGAGDQSLLSNQGLAIFGPDAIPDGRIKKACDVAEAASKRARTVIAAGHLKMACKIVETVQKQSGNAIWVLHNGKLEQRLQKACRRAIRRDQLVMVTAQSPKAPKKSGENIMVSSLAVGFAEEILYVDGSNSKSRKDQFKTTAVVMKHSSDSWLLHGRLTTPEGRELKEKGLRIWEDQMVEESPK